MKRDFTRADMPGLRMLVDQRAAWAGLHEPRRGDFVQAVNAVVTNAIEHGGGRGTLLLRRADDELECQIIDTGPGFTEDVIPKLAPGINGDIPGCGLWLTRLITDRLHVAPGPAAGAMVTFAMRLDQRDALGADPGRA